MGISWPLAVFCRTPFPEMSVDSFILGSQETFCLGQRKGREHWTCSGSKSKGLEQRERYLEMRLLCGAGIQDPLWWDGPPGYGYQGLPGRQRVPLLSLAGALLGGTDLACNGRLGFKLDLALSLSLLSLFRFLVLSLGLTSWERSAAACRYLMGASLKDE